MPFHVVSLDTGKPLECDGQPIAYETGQEAAQAAQAATQEHGTRYQPRRVTIEVDWRAREKARMASGEYLPIPACWSEQEWWQGRLSDHFAHPSTAKDGMIAFTEDDAKGAQDRQTRLTPGRYLTRYFSDQLSASEIADLAARYSAHFEDLELQVTQDADEIERVYTGGPDSCMSGGASDYAGGDCHPARVYAGPDLGVAFIESANAGISARCVVWPERKRHGRIYGDAVRLGGLLVTAGYASGSMSGARVQRIEYGAAFVMPYVDGISSASDDGEFIRLGGGEIDCQQTNGVSGECYSWHCERCEQGYTDDECSNEVYTRRGRATEMWCDSCVENDAFRCDHTEEWHRSDNAVEMANGETWSQRAFNDDGMTCEATDKNYPADECVTLDDGTVWSQAHFDDHGHMCECGKLFDAEDITCEECKEEEEQEDAPVTSRRPRVGNSSVGHTPSQGISDLPGQLALTLPAPDFVMVRGHKVSVGDTIFYSGVFHAVEVIDPNDEDLPISIGRGFWPHVASIRTSAESIIPELATA